MKASELTKKSITLESVYKNIDDNNNIGWTKCFYPHWVHVSDEVKLQLINDGFKIYQGIWVQESGLIIEW